MKVFSREKYIKEEGYADYMLHRKWVDECDGKPVHGEICGVYFVSDDWCVDVPDVKKGRKAMFTMQDFRDGKIAIIISDRAQLRKVMTACHDMGLKWRSGDDALGYVPPSFTGSYVVCNTKAGLAFCDIPVIRRSVKIVTVDEVKFAAMNQRYRIVIECDGTTTTARMEINGWEVKAAQARRNPADKFSFRIGAETAFNRLFGKKGEKRFKVGDRVVCVAVPDGKKSAVGKHGRVLEVDGEWVSVEFDTEIFGHDCLGKGRQGYCWNCFANTLRHE